MVAPAMHENQRWRGGIAPFNIMEAEALGDEGVGTGTGEHESG